MGELLIFLGLLVWLVGSIAVVLLGLLAKRWYVVALGLVSLLIQILLFA